MTVVYCMLLWIFVSKCDSCSCVRVCRGGVRLCVQGGACIPIRVCMCACMWVCAVTSAAKLYCYYGAVSWLGQGVK